MLDNYVVPTLLKACAGMRLLKFGQMVHAFVVRKGIIKDTFVSNALIHMYANCGELESSERLFNSMEEKDVVSWTALLSAYMNAGLVEEAERVFHSMK